MEECPICFEEVYTMAVIQYCEHKVCFKCVTKLKVCPLCRRNIFSSTPDMKTVHLGLKVCDKSTINFLQTCNRKLAHEAFQVFLTRVNIGDETIWSTNMFNMMINEFKKDSTFREMLCVSRSGKKDFVHIVYTNQFTSVVTRHSLFDFMLPKQSSIKHGTKMGVHLVRTLLYDEETSICMNAIQYAVNELGQTHSIEELTKFFNVRLVLLAKLSLAEKETKDYHLVFDRLSDKYHDFEELCHDSGYPNFCFDIELNRIHSYICQYPNRYDKKMLQDRFTKMNNSLHKILDYLMTHRELKVNEKGLYSF